MTETTTPTRSELLAESCAVKGELLRRRCEASLFFFFKAAWGMCLERATPFCDNWHYHVIADAVQDAVERVLARQSRKKHLILNLPPRTAKSTMLSVCLPAWVWARRPDVRFLTGSSTERLAMDFAQKTRSVLDHEWYQRAWGDRFSMRDDQNVKSYYMNSEGGTRYATSVGGQASGFGGDIIIIDDPLELKDALSDSASEAAYQWYTNVVEQRLNNLEQSLILINHQRFGVRDLTGLLLERQPGRFELLSLPAEASAPVVPVALRTRYRNGLLFPERLSEPVLVDRRVGMGSWQFEAQFNQRPSSAEGGVFKRRWWRYWTPAGSSYPAVVRLGDDGAAWTAPQRTVPAKFVNVICAWDMAFKGKADSDRVAGGVIGLDAEGNKYLLDATVGTMGFLDTLTAVVALYERWHQRGCSAVIVEDTANGPAVIETLKGKVPLIAVQTKGMSKLQRAADTSRATSTLAQVEAGQVWLPHPACAPWVEAFVEECALFPNGKHDDMVDMLVHGVRRLTNAVLPGAFAI